MPFGASKRNMLLYFFSASAIFCFTSSTLTKHFPLRSCSSRETKKTLPRGDTEWIGTVGYGSHTFFFCHKLLNTQQGVSRRASKLPITKWANVLKESSKKNSLMLNTASHNNTRWYKWVPRTLTQQGKPVLEGACPPEDNSGWFFRGGSPLLYKVIHYTIIWNSKQLGTTWVMDRALVN